MGNWKTIGASCAGLALTACASTDFAPPDVDLTCSGAAGGCTADLSDALTDVDAFITQYRKEANASGNSKRWFDIPAIVAGVGGATAMALGANADVAIGTGAFGALAASGRTYYAPGEKADAYADAMSAFICIQQEVVGLQQSSDTANIAASLAPGSTAPTLDEEYRAYVTVRNAALKVENTTRQRLSKRGSLENAESISALVEKYQKQETDDAAKATGFLAGAGTPSYQDYRINLEALAPKLETCALIAKG